MSKMRVDIPETDISIWEDKHGTFILSQSESDPNEYLTIDIISVLIEGLAEVREILRKRRNAL